MSDHPVHRPLAYEAPIPGTHWYSACDPDRPRVGSDGVCLGCGGRACPECGRERCPDHVLGRSFTLGAPTVREMVDGVGRGRMEGP